MKSRKENILLSILTGAGLYLLDSARERLGDQADDLRGKARDHYENVRGRAKDFYETASDRVGRASDVLRGEDNSGLSAAAALLIGVGVGVGVGLLFAPSSGEAMRENIADRVQEFGGKVKERFTKETEAAGTYGN
jgi:uncharacterized protein YjbJ (UPF0337 family)